MTKPRKPAATVIRLWLICIAKRLTCGCDIGDSRIWERIWTRLCQWSYDDIGTIYQGETEGAW